MTDSDNSFLFETTFRPFASLTQEDWNDLSNCFQKLILHKSMFFLKEGDICKSIAFIEKGSVVYSSINPNGSEVTTDFSFEGQWVTNNLSRITQTPSSVSIKTLEDSILWVINQNRLEMLMDQIPRLEKVGRILMEQAYIKLVTLSMDLQTLSAKERYVKLCNQHPAILQKVPLYHIANYLGIAPKSLSRIRKELIETL